MKKLLVLGTLVLAASAFAATPATTTQTNNMTVNHAAHGSNGMGSMMTPEMIKTMEESGMMKDGKCVMMENMMKNGNMQNMHTNHMGTTSTTPTTSTKPATPVKTQ